eukprot:GHVT01069587.1.p1 GENE.GHVT01069587.1~~GHVT01069587.1.p1  ORF type:complete len:1166 (-),score=348.87 GHVT01069587.1:777-4274(-)
MCARRFSVASARVSGRLRALACALLFLPPGCLWASAAVPSAGAVAASEFTDLVGSIAAVALGGAGPARAVVDKAHFDSTGASASFGGAPGRLTAYAHGIASYDSYPPSPGGYAAASPPAAQQQQQPVEGRGSGSFSRAILDLASCDPMVHGACCLAPRFCHPDALCETSGAPTSLAQLANALPKCVCPRGFYGDGRSKGTGCHNIDECATGEAGCAQVCTDLSPGFACSCEEGYRLAADGMTCVDVDECAEGTSGCQFQCTNLPGTFECQCPLGLALTADGRACEDVDECTMTRQMVADMAAAAAVAFATNAKNVREVEEGTARAAAEAAPGVPTKQPSMLQRMWNAGEGQGGQGSQQQPRGYWSKARALLQNDFDVQANLKEGSRGGPCSGGGACVNTYGSFYCMCPTGYRREVGSPTNCVDRDECAEGLGDGTPACASDGSQLCTNLPGSYSCACAAGYRPAAAAHTPAPEKLEARLALTRMRRLADPHPQAARRPQDYHSSDSPPPAAASFSASSSSASSASAPASVRRLGAPLLPPPASSAAEWTHLLTSTAALLAGAPGGVATAGASPFQTGLAATQGTAGLVAGLSATREGAAGLYQLGRHTGGSQNENLNGYMPQQQLQQPKQPAQTVAGMLSAGAGMMGGLSMTAQSIEQLMEVNDVLNPESSNVAGSGGVLGFQGWKRGKDEKKQGQAADPPAVSASAPPPSSPPSSPDSSPPSSYEVPSGSSVFQSLLSSSAQGGGGTGPTALGPFLPGSSRAAGSSPVVSLPPDLPSPPLFPSLRCLDIDECAEGSLSGSSSSSASSINGWTQGRRAACPIAEQTCVNTPGSFHCECPRGFEFSADATSCIDVNECRDGKWQGLEHVQACQHKCANTLGSYTCSCYEGYRLVDSGGACADIDECAEGLVTCGPGADCFNLPGSFSCSCPPGFELAKSSASPAPSGTAKVAVACVDTDECANGTAGCSHGCENSRGSFRCTCPRGLSLGSDERSCGSCRDTPGMCSGGTECRQVKLAPRWLPSASSSSSSGASLALTSRPLAVAPRHSSALGISFSSAEPHSDDVGWKCVCPSGYRMAVGFEGSSFSSAAHSSASAPPTGVCVDIDECAETSLDGRGAPCASGKQPCCQNLPGGYRCLEPLPTRGFTGRNKPAYKTCPPSSVNLH